MDPNQNTNPGSWPKQPTPPSNLPGAPTGQPSSPKPPPPPPPEITLRTMQSDVASLRQSGGASPTPKPFTPPELREITPPAPMNAPRPAVPPPPPPTAGRMPPANFPQTKTVKPEQFSAIESFSKPKVTELSTGSKDKGKTILFGVGMLFVLIGFVALGYFVIFPMIFPTETPPGNDLVVAPPVVTPPITDITPITPPPVVTTPLPSQPTTPLPSQPTTPPPPPVSTEKITHQSFFPDADAISDAKLSSVNLASIKQTLVTESDKVASPEGAVIEITMNDANGQIASSMFLYSLVPGISNTVLSNLAGDFTTLLYFDESGVWPAYIFKATSASTQGTITSALEASNASLKNLFVNDPGTASASGFKSGQASGVATRYLPYSQKGASVDLAWKNGKLLISTNYAGTQRILSGL